MPTKIGEKTLDSFQEGRMLLIDKPLHWTSFDVVNRLRIALCKYFKVKKLKVGHAGTLDPLATGLLILCTGKWTKKIDEIQGMVKTYNGTILLGATTPSYDLESEVDAIFSTQHIDQSLIEEVRQKFIGITSQYPPSFSAIKLNGKRAYEMARKGEDVQMKSRQIEITQFVLNTDNFPDILFSVTCSKGTYIRSLAHDFGKALGSGAYLSRLHRDAIGTYHNRDAWAFDALLAEFSNKEQT